MSQVKPFRWFETRLAARTRVCPSYVRITLAGRDLDAVSPTLLDQRVKLALGGESSLDALAGADDWFARWRALGASAPALRTYTLARVRPGAVDIDVVVPPSGHRGPGIDFATSAPVGTRVGLIAADRTRDGHDHVGVAWQPGEARRVLVVGDDTAVPAVRNICRSLRPGVQGRVLLEVPTDGDVQDVAVPRGVEVDWFVRERGQRIVTGAAGAAHDDLWVEGCAGDRFAWVAGESAWVRGLRPLVADLGFARHESSFMGYWRLAA